MNDVKTTTEWTLNYTNSSSTSSGTFNIATDEDDKITYKESDNIGYLDASTDIDGLADYIDVRKDANQSNISAKDIQKLPARSDNLTQSVTTGSNSSQNLRMAQGIGSSGKLKSVSIVGHRSKAKTKKIKTTYNSSYIETPSKRSFENEKYQCVVTDSVAGYYLKGDIGNIEPRNTESYFPLIENEYLKPTQEPLSTFGIDVDNASYAVMRTKINGNNIVPKDAVRIEEFINYFDYNYPEPDFNQPFSINLENATCPWNEDHNVVRIGLKGKDINYVEKQNSNLVFLIDVSGSMDSENKLPLVKKSMKLLVDQMGANDRIAIVTYAGAAGLALESTPCNEKDFIKKKIDKLDAGGSTAGGEGIKLAYNVAVENLVTNGNNRVIMCTDGDFNVGQSTDSDMKNLIVNNRNKGVFITVCGFGMGNYQDSKMETIADNGNGNYFYIDTYRESEKSI